MCTAGPIWTRCTRRIIESTRAWTTLKSDFGTMMMRFFDVWELWGLIRFDVFFFVCVCVCFVVMFCFFFFTEMLFVMGGMLCSVCFFFLGGREFCDDDFAFVCFFWGGGGGGGSVFEMFLGALEVVGRLFDQEEEATEQKKWVGRLVTWYLCYFCWRSESTVYASFFFTLAKKNSREGKRPTSRSSCTLSPIIMVPWKIKVKGNHYWRAPCFTGPWLSEEPKRLHFPEPYCGFQLP